MTEALYRPAEVAEKLDISVATLRKYSLLVEKETHQESYFMRNDQNTRMYHDQDVADFETLIKQSKETGVTLQQAVQEIFKPRPHQPSDQTKPVSVADSAAATATDDAKMVQLFQVVGDQSRQLTSLKLEVDRLKATVEHLTDLQGKVDSQIIRAEAPQDIGVSTPVAFTEPNQANTAATESTEQHHFEDESAEQPAAKKSWLKGLFHKN